MAVVSAETMRVAEQQPNLVAVGERAARGPANESGTAASDGAAVASAVVVTSENNTTIKQNSSKNDRFMTASRVRQQSCYRP